MRTAPAIDEQTKGQESDLVDVDRLEEGALVHHRLAADPGLGLGEALTGEDVEVGVLFEPRFEILRADEPVRVVVHWGSVAAVEACLHLVHREQRISGSVRQTGAIDINCSMYGLS